MYIVGVMEEKSNIRKRAKWNTSIYRVNFNLGVTVTKISNLT